MPEQPKPKEGIKLLFQNHPKRGIPKIHGKT